MYTTRPRDTLALLLLLMAAVVGCAAPTPAPGATTLTLDIAPYRRACMAEGPRQCLVVRREGDTTWTNFFDPIDGFAHEAGYRYLVRVERLVVARPPADGSSFRYRLLEVLRKERDAGEGR